MRVRSVQPRVHALLLVRKFGGRANVALQCQFLISEKPHSGPHGSSGFNFRVSLHSPIERIRLPMLAVGPHVAYAF